MNLTRGNGKINVHVSGSVCRKTEYKASAEGGLYRSPAVALMPDLTPNRLRSRPNAVINLLGAVGGV